MKSYSATVIGLGAIGLGYDLNAPSDRILSHTRACQLEPRIQIACGIDPDPARRSEFSRVTGAPAYSSIKDLASLPPSDVVIIATPTATHLAVFKQIAPMRPRLVILEKPIADSIASADTIYEIAKAHAIPMAINYIRLADPALSQLAQHIRRGEYGKVQEIRGRYCRGLLNNGSHIVSFLLACCGSPKSFRRISQGYVPSGLQDISVDCRLEFDTFRATLRCVEPLEVWDFGIELDLECARIVLGPSSPFLRIDLLGNRTLPFPTQACDLDRYQKNALSKAMDWLDSGCSDNSSWENAYQTLQICEGILLQKAEN